VEGIAVGLSTKILPHNMGELIRACIAHLKGEKFQLLPDFPTGGLMDASQYQQGKRGGKVRVRAKIEIVDKKYLVIRDIPFGTTTSSLIDSIIKAAAKSKIKIKKVNDNTAQHVEIVVELPAGVSPEQTVDALYAFSDCEVSISPLACVIEGDKPIFTNVEYLLEYSAEHTKKLLGWELDIEKQELEEKWHFACLERIFIEKKIYQKIETCETWEAVIETIQNALRPHTKKFKFPITEADILKLTEIRIKRLSKFDKSRADEHIAKLEAQILEVEVHLSNLNNYTIQYFENLYQKYAHLFPRQTQISNFEVIQAATVALNNERLYINRAEGFIGFGLKKDEFLEECSDLDEVIIFQQDGSYSVIKIAEKVFVGKNPLYVGIWRKNDERKVYNVAYTDLDKGGAFVKRFSVLAVTRDKKYPLCEGVEKCKVLHFSANANGEAETIGVLLSPQCTAKIKEFDYDFSNLDIKGRASRGNVLTKYPVRKIKVKAAGNSTLGGLQVWIDETSGKLNTSGYGRLLGEFSEQDRIIVFYKTGGYELSNFEILTNRFELKDILILEKFNPEAPVSAVYYDGERKATYAKRFRIETSTLYQRFDFLPNQHEHTQQLFVSLAPNPQINYQIKVSASKILQGSFDIAAQTEVIGWKSLGTKISDSKLLKVEAVGLE
jgi:topoisomerase-4 subunit A